jgi:O-antigen ligase
VPVGRTVDNFWLHLLVETGAIGVGLFAAALAVAVASALRAARSASRDAAVVLAGTAALAVVVGVDSLTEMLLEGNTTTFAMWCLLGIATTLGASPDGTSDVRPAPNADAGPVSAPRRPRGSAPPPTS